MAKAQRATHRSMCSTSRTCARHQPHVGAGRADFFWLGTRVQRKRSGVGLFDVPRAVVSLDQIRRQDSSMNQRRKRQAAACSIRSCTVRRGE